MTKKELLAALLDLGVAADPKMRKKDLEALLADKQAPPALAVPPATGEAWIPSWVLDDRRQKLPAWAPFERVVHESKPKRPPVGGGKWVHTELPQWLKQ